MKAVLANLGMKKTTERTNTLSLSYINNPDGTPRWVFPTKSKEPLFLNCYHVSGLKAQLFALAVRAVFKLKMQHLVFNKMQVSLSQKVVGLVNLELHQWALFTGTVGPNRKYIFCTKQASGEVRFHKYGLTDKSQELLTNELNALKRVSHLHINTIQNPHPLHRTYTSLTLSDVSQKGHRINLLTNTHIHAMSSLYNKTKKELNYQVYCEQNDFENRLQKLSNIAPYKLPKGIVKKLTSLYQQNKQLTIKTAFAHGDFTPWNMYVQKDTCLHVYDFELASNHYPMGFDLFHFVMQQGILVDQLPFKKIKPKIDALLDSPEMATMFNNSQETLMQYFTQYLILNVTTQLELFAKQAELHTQVSWLINTWNEALSYLLQNDFSPRQLFVLDMFDFLHNQNYTGIKLGNHAPELVGLNTDIDLCVEKPVIKKMKKFMKNHPLTKKLISKSYSNQTNTIAVFEDGNVLSVDMIHQFRRKGIEYYNAASVINNAYVDEYGVRKMDLMDQTRYIGLFYGLNNAPIPGKFQAYEQIIQYGETKVDFLLYDSFKYGVNHTKELKQIFSNNNSNKPMAKFKNKLAYFLDVCKTIVSSKGLTITVSGVDGAGKSTVIEALKTQLNKRLRKPVVVLRHRPSILPILSALTKGKAKAEQESMSTLPRQGNNKSFIGSMLRFAYYYTDYILGQFVVYAKYNMRGYIVLYDRYYFDFINDSKRTNIVLPKAIMKFGYYFLMKPDLNFFLYAQPETILERKQELDRKTIVKLTDEYIALFNQLEKNKNQYVSFENEDLNETLAYMLDSTLKKAV